MSDDLSEVGYLTSDMFTRLEWAVHNAAQLVPWLRVAGYIRSSDDDVRVQASSSRPLGLPATWIAAEEISRLMGALNAWPELEDAAHDDFGAALAVMLVREVETAGARWPFEDRPHGVKFIRCPKCQMLSLRYIPPRFGGDGVIVKCTVDGATLDEDGFAYQARLVEEENARGLGDRGGSAGKGEPFAGDDLQVGA